MSRCTRAVMMLALIVVPAAAIRADPGSEVAQQAADGNRASVEMIESYYGTVTVEATDRPAGNKYIQTSKYWRDRDGVRIAEQTKPERLTDVEVRGGKTTVYTTTPGRVRPPNEAGMIVGDHNRRTVETDAWEWSLFTLPVGVYRKPAYTVYTLADAIRKGQVEKAGWTTRGGRRMARVVVTLDAGTRTYEVWVDPDVNWLVRRCIHTIRVDDGSVVWENTYEVEEFTETAPGLFVPVRTTSAIKFEGRVVKEGVTTMADLVVNSPSPARPAMPRPPGGGLVLNELDGTVYSIDATGKRIGSAKPIGESYSPPYPAEDPLGPAGGRSFVGRILIGVAVLTAVGGLLAWRRTRALRQA